MKSAVKKIALAALAVAMSLVPTPSHAELIDNGNGLIYDTVLDITWAQEPAVTPMTWDDAKSYAAELRLGGVGGWRLPYISVVGGEGPYSGNPVDCSTASEEQCRDNEMGYMFYHNDLALFPTLNVFTPYWSGTESSPDRAWSFDFGDGSQNGGEGQSDLLLAWAVHEGNVGAGGSPPPSNIHADFTFSPTEISENEVVVFTDRSQGEVVSWLWTFDGAPPEGETDTNQNPSRYWTRSGQYNVRLEVWDANGNSDVATKSVFIQAVLEPEAAFSWYPAAPEAGEEVHFIDQSAFNPTSWLWVFGTSGTSTEQE
jgi:hypothetical protein